MSKNEKSKNILLLILLVSLVSLSIAYATLTQRLYITSQTTVAGQSSWKVEFTSAVCETNSHAYIIHDFDPSNNTTVLSGLISKFMAPGGTVTCRIRVENKGSINARLSTFTLGNDDLAYEGTGDNKTSDEGKVNGKMQYSIVYASGDANEGLAPATDDTLPKDTYRDLILTISYPLTASMPDNDVIVSGFKTAFLYVQTDNE